MNYVPYKSHFFKSLFNKKLIENLSYLSFLQIFNLVTPFITYAYLIRTIGTGLMGLIVYFQAIMQYSAIFIDFGFNISATKDISINRDDKKELSKIISNVFVSKFLLFLLLILFLFITFLLLPKINSNWQLFLLSSWPCFYSIIFPVYYFQGLEKMKFIFFVNLITRTLFIFFIFLFVKDKSDYLFVPFFYGIGAFIAGIISIFLIFYKDNLKFVLPKLFDIKHTLLDSFPIFISTLSIRLYSGSTRLVVGSFIGMTEVTIYDISEKIITLLKQPIAVFSQAIFPLMCKTKDLVLAKKSLLIMLLFNSLILLILFFSIDELILIFFGKFFLMSATIIKILSFSIIFITLNNFLGTQILVAFGYLREYRNSLLISLFIYLFQLIIFWKFFNYTLFNLSAIIVFTEFFVVVIMYLYTLKLNIWQKI
jgi:PST family polysaccharide transporter